MAVRISQWVNVPTIKPDDVSLILEIHGVERDKQLPSVVPWLSRPADLFSQARKEECGLRGKNRQETEEQSWEGFQWVLPQPQLYHSQSL